MKNKILSFLGFIDLRTCRREIRDYLYRSNTGSELFITDVKVFRKSVQITTHTPEYMIRKEGRSIHKLRKHLSGVFNKDIRINIRKSKL